MTLNKLINEYLNYEFKTFVIADQDKNISIINFRLKIEEYCKIILQKKKLVIILE